MGRCYDFGVPVHAGCEQAMTVTAEGGSCGCGSCGARCEGLFAGCAPILAVPGRRPTTAPAWALERAVDLREQQPAVSSAPTARSSGHPSTAAAPVTTASTTTTTRNGTPAQDPAGTPRQTLAEAPAPGPRPAPGVEEVRTLRIAVSDLRTQLDRAGRKGTHALVAAVEALRNEIASRDEQLVESVAQLCAHQFAAQAKAVAEANEAVAGAVRVLADRVERLEARLGDSLPPDGTSRES